MILCFYITAVQLQGGLPKCLYDPVMETLYSPFGIVYILQQNLAEGFVEKELGYNVYDMYMMLETQVAHSVYCLTTDWTTRVRSPTEAKDSSSILCVQTSSEARSASYPLVTGCPFQGVKRGRCLTLTTKPI
jgi:hypothetical protein